MTKTFITSVLIVFTTVSLQAGQPDGNPFKKLGYKADIATFSSNEEFHDQSQIVQIGSVWFDTETNVVVGLVQEKDTLVEFVPELISTSIDPHCEKYYSISPYAYCFNNPIKFIDPDGLSPIYDMDGNFLGTDDQGIQGLAIMMDKNKFIQNMAHTEAMSLYTLYENKEAFDKMRTHYIDLANRPDYDGFVTIEEGIEWAKKHPDALKNPTPDNTLYANTALLDFGNLKTSDLKFGESTAVNLFNVNNTWNSGMNVKLRSTVYALGRVHIILEDSNNGIVSVVNDNATDYDWNKGGTAARKAFINAERVRAGLNDSHGFKVIYYGKGKVKVK